MQVRRTNSGISGIGNQITFPELDAIGFYVDVQIGSVGFKTDGISQLANFWHEITQVGIYRLRSILMTQVDYIAVAIWRNADTAEDPVTTGIDVVALSTPRTDVDSCVEVCRTGLARLLTCSRWRWLAKGNGFLPTRTGAGRYPAGRRDAVPVPAREASGGGKERCGRSYDTRGISTLRVGYVYGNAG